MFNLFKKNADEVSRVNPGYEETERRTPKMGVILLILMVIAGIYFGLYAMDDLSNIPTRPADLSSCSYKYQTNSDGVAIYNTKFSPYSPQEIIDSVRYEDSTSCATRLSVFEKTGGIEALFQQRITVERQIDPIIKEYTTVEQQVNQVRSQIDRVTGEYGVGLQEKQAGIPTSIFLTTPSQQSIVQLRQQEAPLVERMNALKTQIGAFKPALDSIDKELIAAYAPVFTAHTRAMKWYEFKVFLLQFILIIPFFFFALRKYLELHRKNSPYTIILTAIVGVLGFLLLKIILFWFWGLFLEEILRVLIEWFGKYQLLKSLVLYVGMLLSFAIFGGAVYFLQKRIFDTRRVTIRRFRMKQCPQCQTNLDLAAEYCPNCGAHIREACTKCGKDRFIGMPFCPHCGDHKEITQ